MKHDITSESLGEYGEPMVDAIQACVHCGFCLPTCPTYQELEQEADSPRGRIFLMKEVLEGTLDPEQAQPHIDRCLGCVACVTACPSGVQYGELVSSYRATFGKQAKLTAMERLKRAMVFTTLPYPSRFRWALRLGQWTRGLSFLTPRALRPMLGLVPKSLPRSEKLHEVYPAKGNRIGRVALLAGCAQQVLRPSINLATIRVLNRRGIEVIVPPSQGCCGALAWHVGNSKLASNLAIANLNAFPSDVDAIVTNAAGCGSGIHEYPTILRGSESESAAVDFARRTVDVSVYLDQLAEQSTVRVADEIRVAMQDACHLQHAQGVTSAPRNILSRIEGLQLIELADATTCCGSAGTYNIDQPEIAAALGKRKAEVIRQANCDVVVSGNIGCLIQMQHYLSDGTPEVLHTMELLDRIDSLSKSTTSAGQTT